MLLPESIESFSMVRGGLQSTRRSQTYSEYKRFVGDSRVVERDESSFRIVLLTNVRIDEFINNNSSIRHYVDS